MAVVDSHAHIRGEGLLPRAFFERAADQWAAKSDDRTPEISNRDLPANGARWGCRFTGAAPMRGLHAFEFYNLS